MQQRMQAAEKRYRDGLLADEDGAMANATSSALAEMQGVIAACAKQRGCAVPNMLTAYERLLKATPQGPAG